MDLGEYDNDQALSALVQAATDPNTDDWCVLQTCGESAARIWVKRDSFQKETFNSFRSLARMGAYDYILGYKPEWIEEYNLEG